MQSENCKLQNGMPAISGVPSMPPLGEGRLCSALKGRDKDDFKLNDYPGRRPALCYATLVLPWAMVLSPFRETQAESARVGFGTRNDESKNGNECQGEKESCAVRKKAAPLEPLARNAGNIDVFQEDQLELVEPLANCTRFFDVSNRGEVLQRCASGDLREFLGVFQEDDFDRPGKFTEGSGVQFLVLDYEG